MRTIIIFAKYNSDIFTEALDKTRNVFLVCEIFGLDNKVSMWQLYSSGNPTVA